MATKRKKKRKIKKGFLIFAIIMSALLVIVATGWAVIAFVPNINILTVNRITVSGDEVYSAEEIIDVSDINNGVSVLKLNFSKIESKLESELPYIKSADIKYSLNGVLNIKLTADKIFYSIKNQGQYYHLNSNFKFLDSSSDVRGDVILCGVELKEDAQKGKISVDSNNESVNILRNIEKRLSEKSIKVDVIDLEDKNDILLVYGGRYIIELGSDDLLDNKIKLLATIVNDINTMEDQTETGRILLKHWSESDRLGSVISEDIQEYLNKY